MTARSFATFLSLVLLAACSREPAGAPVPALTFIQHEDGTATVIVDEAAMTALCAAQDLPALPSLDAIDAYSYRRLHEEVAEVVAKPIPARLARLGMVFDGHEFVEEAVACYERAVAAGSRDPAVWHLLGRGAASLGDRARAIEAFEQSLQLEADSPATIVRLAEAYIDAGRLDEAATYVERYTSGVGAADPSGAFLRGRLATEQGRWEEARVALEACIASNPQHGRALFLLSRVAKQLGSDARAKVYGARAAALPRGGSSSIRDPYEQAAYRAADSFAYHQAVMKAAWQARDYSRAYDSARELVRRHPDDVLAQRNLAALAKLRGRMDEAVRHAEIAVELNPRYVRGLITLAELYRDVGRHDDAVRTVDAALAIDPEYWSGYLSRGAILLSAGRANEALESTRRGLEHLPDHVVGLTILAQCRVTLNDTAGARLAVDRILELQPNNGWALRIRAELEE